MSKHKEIKIKVLNLQQSVSYKPECKSIMIRIMDTVLIGKDHYSLDYKDDFISVKEIYYDDIDFKSNKQYEVKDNDYYKMKVFKEDNKNDIMEFIRENLNNIEEIVIHCHYGESRSPGIALSIDKVFKGFNFLYKFEDKFIPSKEFMTNMRNFNRYNYYLMTNIRIDKFSTKTLYKTKFEEIKYKFLSLF